MDGLHARITSFPFRELPGIEVSLSKYMALNIQPSEDNSLEPLEISHERLRVGISFVIAFLLDQQFGRKLLENTGRTYVVDVFPRDDPPSVK